MDYSIFPPINATLNGISTVLLITGFLLIKSGRKEAHQKVMLSALVTSAIFLVCYLVYHYGVGHTEFPKAYPTARVIYLGILIPHIILAVVNVPLILMLVIAAFRGRFERHRKLARFTFPSWLFVSVTGVVIYFMIYVWFPAPDKDSASGAGPAKKAEGAEIDTAAPVPAGGEPGGGAEAAEAERITVVEESTTAGDLVFEPAFQAYRADVGQRIVTVTFEVRNRGDEPAEIEDLVSGCECLSIEIDRNPVPGGGAATITGIFDTEKLRGRSERKISVKLPGRSRSVFLTTRIETDPIYTIEPPMTTWKVGAETEPRTVQFRVERDDPIRVLSADSKRAEVSSEVVTVEEGRVYDIVLTPETTESSLLGIVRIETDCEIESHARPLAYFSIQ